MVQTSFPPKTRKNPELAMASNSETSESGWLSGPSERDDVNDSATSSMFESTASNNYQKALIIGTEWENASPQMLALGELEFRKAFLILSYLGRAELEDIIDEQFIRSLKNLPMNSFEIAIWRKFGRTYTKESDRIQNIDWDANKTHCYHCHVDLQGYATFKGPFLEPTKTQLQRVIGDENILQVKFEETSEDKKSHYDFLNYCFAYEKVAKQGILLGLRRYRFLVYRDGGRGSSSSVKCYFVRTDSGWAKDSNDFLFGKNIELIRLSFMHVHTVPTLTEYMSRFSLILSRTIKPDVDLSNPNLNVEIIDDIPCKVGNTIVAGIHTDGTGFISQDLALKCPNNIYRGFQLLSKTLKNESNAMEGPSSSKRRKFLNNEPPPLLTQVLLFYNGLAAKGTLLVNKTLPKSTIQIRPSMIKVETDPETQDINTFNSLEIVTTSNKPKKAHLSIYLIALLHFGGVPSEFFLNLLANSLQETERAYYDTNAAISIALRQGGIGDDSLIEKMIFCGIPLHEPFLKSGLNIMIKEERERLKKGRIPVDECYYLMGTADPTRTLNPNEVCVILNNGQVTGDVLVYKHPGLHTGDIHVLRATYIKDLEKFVGKSKYAIFFPVVGPRSLPDEMANSNLDGDVYWVSTNQELLKHFTPSTPRPAREEDLFMRVQQNIDISKLNSDELELVLFREFLKSRFQPSHTIGIASENWLVYMDRVLTAGVSQAENDVVKTKINRLVNIYYDAVDSPKTGKKVEVPNNIKARKYPHFMGKSSEMSYKSKSLLGLIYEKVESFLAKKDHPIRVWKLPCFNVEVVPQDCIDKWENHYKNYLKEIMSAFNGPVRNKMYQEILDKYKKILYGGTTEFQESKRPNEDIYNEALRIYQIVYNRAEARGTASCGFAWRLAGHALCQYYIFKAG
ncbi:hypothetical protein LUZ60_009334 [Juncus effusus]|nr:hypothetical protein LUZ60_009334 [Juncus effusus]